jgi:starch-binding outer membrane protein, SusD/RagB family
MNVNVLIRPRRLTLHWGAILGMAMGLQLACSPGNLVGTADIPSNLSDPAATKTPAGALSAYWGTLALFRSAFGGPAGDIETTGMLSDELQDGVHIGAVGLLSVAALDIRKLPEYTDPAMESESAYPTTYSQLQKVRGQAAEASGLLRDFAPDASPALRGHLYTLQGYSEVQLAELFCSGIPLSTLDYSGDYTLKPGSSTTDVLTHAQALFDTALALSTDSVRFMNLARVGKARVLLDLGNFAQAAQAAAEVPTGYRYQISYTADLSAHATNFAYNPAPFEGLSESDREGVNGLDYRSSADPRTSATAAGRNGPTLGGTMTYRPDKYAADGSSSIVLADWVEARLIQAEAALQVGDPSWLATLNQLRESAITPALPDTTDPGTSDPGARVNLLFRERAFWLFLTGHRQGDMRRLIRQYGRPSLQVYPVGAFPGNGASYGTDVTAPIPASERVSNPQFTGCLSRGS